VSCCSTGRKTYEICQKYVRDNIFIIELIANQQYKEAAPFRGHKRTNEGMHVSFHGAVALFEWSR